MRIIIALAVALAGMAHAQTPEVDQARGVAQLTYVQLYGWTEHTAEMREYSAPLKDLLYVAYPSALMECQESGTVTVDTAAVVTATSTAFNAVLLPAMTRPGEISLLSYHARAVAHFIGVAEEALSTCRNRPPPPSMTPTAFVTPTSIDVPGVLRQTIRDFAIARTIGSNTWSGGGGNKFPGVLDLTVPNLVLMASGDYGNDRLTRTLGPNPPRLHLKAEVTGGVVIHPNPVGGSQTLYPENWHNFEAEGWVILGDDKTAIQGEIPSHRNWLTHQTDHNFTNCVMVGSWDPTKTHGPRPNQFGTNRYDMGATRIAAEYGSTWIVTDDSLPWGGGFREQYFYEHGVTAPGMLVAGVKARHCGRSFFHLAARAGEVSVPSDGLVHIRDCEVRDVCLEDNGGGSVVDVKGHVGDILLERFSVYLGCDEGLHPQVAGNITGAVVVSENGLGYVNTLTIRDSWFEVGSVYPGKGSARRPNVVLNACRKLVLDRAHIQQHAGADATALQIFVGRLEALDLDRASVVIGECKLGSNVYRDPRLDGSGYRAMLDDLEANPPTTYAVTIR